MSDSSQPATFQAPEIEEVALLFPSYDIHSLIACGGMGAVYQATQRSLDRVVAIKILPREFSVDEAFRTGFEAEAKAMAKLNHPNLIGVYDFGEADGMLFIIMEYVAGKSLFHSAHGLAVDPGEAIRIVSEVCDGLAHAHAHGILHRDIKPGNILLDSHVSPKIGDFGLARALESKIEEGEQIFGTPGYTAPEVLEPPFTFDQRADVFSVGVMLHELLTGKLPGDDTRPASVISGCNARLDGVIRRATHPDPASRYSSAAELSAELEKITSSPSRAIISSAAAAAAGRPYVPPKKLKSSSSGLGFTFFLIAAAAAAAYFFLNRETPPPVEPQPAPEATLRTIEITPTPQKVDKPTNQRPKPVDPPKPIETPAPAPEPVMPQPVPQPEPEPIPSSPQFNVPEFLGKARGIMGGRIAPDIENHKKEVIANTRAYVRKYERLIRKNIEDADMLETREEQLEQAYERWQAEDHRIPAVLPEELNPRELTLELHQEYLLKQENLNKDLLRKVSSQSSVYVLGIENQIERLRDTGDDAAIDLLEEEIERAKTEEGYFTSLFVK